MNNSANVNSAYWQIAQVLGRSLGLQRAPWLYVAAFGLFGVIVLGDLWAPDSARSLASLRTAFGVFLAVALQVFWVFSASALMRLNTPTASRMVPAYVSHLRRTALCIWLSICVLVGLLGGRSFGEVVFLGLGAGLFMLLISTPLRWPMPWLGFMGVLLFAGKHSIELVEGPVVKVLIDSPSTRWSVAGIGFLAMAWLVTRLIAANGNRHATVLSAFAGREISGAHSESATRLAADLVGPWMKRLLSVGYRLQFPWRLYLRHALALPQASATKEAQTSHVLARALLGLGPSVHWVLQVAALATLWAVVLLVVVILPMATGGEIKTISGGWAVVIALSSLMIAVIPTLSLPETLQQTATEQKLMLLLPGIPRGAALNRLLAVRHLRHAFVAWLVAAAGAVALTYVGKDAVLVGGFYLGTLVLLPMVVTDWSRLPIPTAKRALIWLLSALAAPAVGLGAVHWLHVPVSAVAAAAVVYCGIRLALRWKKLARFAQAFPAGRVPAALTVESCTGSPRSA